MTPESIKPKCPHSHRTIRLGKSSAPLTQRFLAVAQGCPDDPLLQVACEDCGATNVHDISSLITVLFDTPAYIVARVFQAFVADDCPHNRSAATADNIARSDLGLGEPHDTLTETLARIAELANLAKGEHADHGAMPPPAELARELLVNLGNLYVEADNAAGWAHQVHRRIEDAVASSCADVNMPFLFGQLLVESLQQAQGLYRAVDACSAIGSLDLTAPSPT